jgi:peptidoglycan-associated lipoprotein
MKKILIVFVVMLGLIAFGCSKKVVKPEAGIEEAPMQGQAMEPVEEITTEPQTEVTGQEMAKVEEEMVPRPEKPDLGDVYFDFDRYEIEDSAKPVLREIATWLINNSDGSVLIEGHCDDRGTNEYNLALGDRRASAVKNFLISSGVSAMKTETVSFGEEKPVCSEMTEDCWAKNRRAHFLVTEGGRLGAAMH